MREQNVQCTLCPNNCRIFPDGRGQCGVRVNLDGILYSLVHSQPCAVHVDPIEKKPLFHVCPGTRSFSLATAGCCLRCTYCQNWQISQALPEDVRSYTLSPEAVVNEALKAQCQSIAYTYTEPTVFYEYMYDTAQCARTRGLKNVYITSGYINPDPLEKLCAVIDAANVDLKGFTEHFYATVTQGHLQPVLDALRIMRRAGVFIEITNLIVPTLNDDRSMIRDMCRWIVEELGVDTPIHFSRFHPAYQLKQIPPTPLATVVDARAIAKKQGLNYVYIGNVPELAGQDTVCPSCGNNVITRQGYSVITNDLSGNQCPFCQHEIPGIWKGTS